MAAVVLGMAREGTYPLLSALNGTAQLFSWHSLVRAVPWEMDHLYAQLAAQAVTFISGPPWHHQSL